MTNNNVLVIVAHPDDETIGMGGTIKKHFDWGDNVFVVSMTDGIGARGKNKKISIQERKSNSIEASKILGFKWFEQFQFTDNQLDRYSIIEIIKTIEIVKEKLQPKLVYTHSSSDLNIDHKILSSATLTAFRPQPEEVCREIRLFEVSSATDYGYKNITGIFTPNLFVNISETWKFKLSALQCYGAEIKKFPHTRSLKALENLSKVRGSSVGLPMAEAFEVVRKIIN
tara:strand:+ start:5472 stop:6152 length:681 start_codon:yes stop_codon:yes gene_type:complete